MRDGRNKDWWLGYFLGVIEAIELGAEITPNMAGKIAKDYRDWESEQKEPL